MTADPLPTVQINGVVYGQTILGNTVYVTGEFTSARPAGQPAGSQEPPRSNILAYNLDTGVLIPTWAPSLNAKGLAITSSPDGTKIYVAGEFTSVNGVPRYRIAALDPVTGALTPGFNATVSYRVSALVATNTTLYAGGAFTVGPNNLTRTRLAAFSATTGDLLSWAPTADAEVKAMVMSPDGTRLIVGGAFVNLNGASANGMGALDPVTGALLPWAANTVVKDSGRHAAILTLTTDGKLIYGAGYVFSGHGGNLEGSWAADPTTGQIQWIEDCHADVYSGVPMNGYFYTIEHTHYCGNLGGYPQPSDWKTYMRHALSFTTQATGNLRREPWGYFNFEGWPSPSLVAWYPKWVPGTYTGANQAGWTATANSKYLLVGGEFLGVGGVNQQGLVRFAVKGTAPSKVGPQLTGAQYPISVTSKAAGTARVTFPADWDSDSLNLTYSVARNGDFNHPVTTFTSNSTFWDQPMLGFTDTGLTPGQTYTYRVFVTDVDGNQAASPTTSVTIAGTGAPSAYSDLVMADGARIDWRLDDPAGSTTITPAVGLESGNLVLGSTTFGVPGAILNDPDTAISFANSNASEIWETTQQNTSDNMSIEVWVKTSSTTGGRIFGFGNGMQGASGSTDRMLYMTNTGSVIFGANQTNPGPGNQSPSTRCRDRAGAGQDSTTTSGITWSATLGDKGRPTSTA